MVGNFSEHDEELRILDFHYVVPSYLKVTSSYQMPSDKIGILGIIILQKYQ